MSIRLIIIVLLYIPAMVWAQDVSIPVRQISKIADTPDRFEGRDTFEWQYTITNNTLRKEKAGSYVEYQNVSLGDIEKVDIQNPLQVVVFYKKFNTVVFLDNQLNETSRINFSNLPKPIVADAAGLASQNRLWIFDVQTQRLGLYVSSQGDFKAITPPFTDPIKHYQSDYNYFYWTDATGRCFAANIYGNVNFLGNVPDFDKAQIVSPKQLLLQKGNVLSLYSLETGKGKPIEIIEKTFSGFHYSAQILSIFTAEEINQYKVTLPE